jgi:hypothetical protein
VAAWVAGYRLRLTFTALTYPIWLAGRGLEHFARLFLAHGPRRAARSTLWQIDGLNDVPADEIVFLARRIDLVSVLLIFTSEALLSARAESERSDRRRWR